MASSEPRTYVSAARAHAPHDALRTLMVAALIGIPSMATWAGPWATMNRIARYAAPMHPLLFKVLCIAAGGAIGAVLRFAMAHVVQRAAGPDFPWGVLAVNALGCLVIGVLGAYFTDDADLVGPWRVFIFIGLLGGFTTFSTFSFETLELMNDGQMLRAGVYVLLTNALCLGATWLGYRATGAWVGA